MALKTVPDGYLSIRETFKRLFDAKFPEWSALASAGKSFEFGRPRDDLTVKLDLPEDRHFRQEREITDFIVEQFRNGGLEIFFYVDGRIERIEPCELAVPFFQSSISHEDFGLAAIAGRTVCLLKSDVDRLATQFTSRKRGRPSDHNWEAIKQVSDGLLKERPIREGLAEAVLDRLDCDTAPDISTLRRKLNEWYGRK